MGGWWNYRESRAAMLMNSTEKNKLQVSILEPVAFLV
jgi:hypothetical protein